MSAAALPPVRIVHRLYGRGNFLRLLPEAPHALVAFDGELAPRRVLRRDIELAPPDMPLAAEDNVLPFHSAARERARQRVADAMAGRGQ